MEDSPRDRFLASPWLVVAVTALVVAVLALVGERIPENGGLGFDGVVYAKIASYPPFDVCKLGIDDYRLQRVVPSAVMHWTLTLIGAEFSNQNFADAWLVYDCIILVLAAGCLVAAAGYFGFSQSDRWLLVVVAMLNYGIAKQTFYDPVLTDDTAFMLGGAMLYAWIANRFWLLIAATLIGCFTWPAVFVGGALLLAFPRGGPEAEVRRSLVWPVVLVAVGAYLTVFYTLYVLGGIVDFNQLFHIGGFFRRPTQYTTTWQPALPLSVAAVVVAIAVMVWSAGVGLGTAWAALRRISVRGALAAVAILILRSATIWSCAASTGSDRHTMLLNGIALLPAAKPLLFVTSFAAYYGIAGVLLLVFWRECWQVLRGEPVGLRLWILFGLLLNLDTEARKSLNSFPALAFFLVEAIRRAGAERTAQWWVAVLAVGFVCSKVWLRINVAPRAGKFMEFPEQYFFMNAGAWMSDLTYVVQSAALAVSVVVLWWFMKQAPGRARR